MKSRAWLTKFSSGSLLAVGALMSTGCESPVDLNPNCPDIGYHAVNVTVRDLVTNVPIGNRATITVRDGRFVESETGPDDPAAASRWFSLASNRDGIYSVHVSRPDYADWTMTDVVVPRATCGITPARLTALLHAH